MTDFAFPCHCGCFDGANLISVVGGDLAAWQDHIAAGKFDVFTCYECGCDHELQDGDTQINAELCCSPRIDSLDVTSGFAAGGDTITITGHCLNVGTLIVRFGGVEGVNVRNIKHESAVVYTPPNPPGIVDVSVENENGVRQRSTIFPDNAYGVLQGGFTYS